MNDEYIKTGRTNQKLETRSKILDSAQYFLNKGLEFNLEDVAKKTGISRATIYRYFSNAEILATEAGLDISTKHPEEIHNNLSSKELDEKILGIQNYYNTLALNHENAFRKYLSAVLGAKPSEVKRGARRKKTLALVLQDTEFTSNEKENLANLFTVMMGIEPLIVTKDVCGLDDDQSLELMKWGMQLLLKAVAIGKE